MTGVVEGIGIGGQGENTIEVTIIPPARILTPSLCSVIILCHTFVYTFLVLLLSCLYYLHLL